MMSASLFPFIKGLLVANGMRFSQLMCVAMLHWDRRPSKAYLPLPCTRPFPHPSERARSAWRPSLYFFPLPVREIAAHREQYDFVDVDLVHAKGVPNLYPLLEHV
jgi:hypothetical protein